MAVHLFGGLRVRDLAAAGAWYERLLGEPAVRPHASEIVWTLADGRSVYVGGGDDLRVARGRLGQLARGAGLGGVVEGRRARTARRRPRRRRRVEPLERRAPQQDGSGALRERSDGPAHLRVEAAVERPARP